MRISVTGENEVLLVARSLWGEQVGSFESIADLLRAELWSRRVGSRRTVVDAVARRMGPAVALDPDRVKQTLADLERVGDLTAGDRGLVAAAPLRVVSLGQGRYRLFGGPATRDLSRELALPLEVCGTDRLARVPSGQTSAFEDRVASAGGLVLSPERWSGVDRSPPADEDWLADLDAELDTNGVPAGAVDAGGGSWQAYRPERGGSQRERWDPRVTEGGGLWRVWHGNGYWVYAWTREGSPDRATGARLWRDDAARTVFALDRSAGSPVRLVARASQLHVDVQLDSLLPRAEYRLLAVHADPAETDGERALRIPSDVWPGLSSVLGARLGLRVETTDGGN